MSVKIITKQVMLFKDIVILNNFWKCLCVYVILNTIFWMNDFDRIREFCNGP